MKKIFFLFLTFFSLAYGYINIHPVVFEKQIDKGGAVEEFTLYNGTNRDIKYSIYKEKTGKKNDMFNWIDFYPETLTLKPGMQGGVKVFVEAPAQTERGEYTGIFGIKEQEIIREIDLKNPKSDIKILTNLKMEIAGFVGEVHSKIVSKEIKLKEYDGFCKLEGKIENAGERRVRLRFYLEEKNNKNLFYLGEKKILSGEKLSLEEVFKEIQVGDKNDKGRKFQKLLIKNNTGDLVLDINL